MKITDMPIASLVEAEYNPRKISEKQLESLMESLTNLDIIEPAVVNVHPDRLNVIISGHQRIKAASRLGFDKYPCYLVKMTPELEREANIRMNKNTGEWDFEILEREFDLAELMQWGFDDDVFDGILTMPNKDVSTGDPLDEGEQTGIIQTNIVFDDKKQLETWYNFQRHLNNVMPGETFAERLMGHMIKVLEDAES